MQLPPGINFSSAFEMILLTTTAGITVMATGAGGIAEL
jgi:hypothetical protein